METAEPAWAMDLSCCGAASRARVCKMSGQARSSALIFEKRWLRRTIPCRRCGAFTIGLISATRHVSRSHELLSPTYIAPARFTDPAAAFEHVRIIYEHNVAFLRDALHRYVSGEPLNQRVRACYPFVRVRTDTVARADSRLSYGFV